MATKNEELENEEGKKKKGGLLVIIIVIVLFVLLLSIMGVIAWLLGSSSSDESEIRQAPQEDTQKEKPQNKKRGSDTAEIGPMYPLDPFTLNLLSDTGSRYVKCTVQLEQNTDLLKTELDKKTAIIRDIIIRTLTAKTFEEISTAKGKERLKDELVGKINEILTDGFIKNVYFTDFVVS